MQHTKVLFLSDWFSNPYKQMLSQSLSDQGADVKEYKVTSFFLKYYLFHYKCNVLHFHEIPIPLTWDKPFAQWLKLSLFALQVAILRLFKVRIIWTIHEWDHKLSSKEVSFGSLYARIFSGCFDAFITHSETSQKSLLKEVGLENKNKAFIIPHGNYIGWYQNEITSLDARKTLDIPNDSSVFLLFGGIYRYKGALEAIDAFQTITQNEAYLLVVGKANCLELEHEIQERICHSQNIKFIQERVSDDEIQIYMNASDCMLLPYKVFTTSGVAILAMSFGKACIAPKVGFFDDVLDDFGTFFYNPDIQAGLSQAMETACHHQDRLINMGMHNLALANEWNWSYVSQKTFDVYQSE